MIQLSNVSVRFGGVTALQPTTLAFRQGQFAVLLGASGAGKSTLLRCLNMLCEPATGNVEVSGLGSLRDRKVLQQHRRRTGMIFQQHQLIGRHSAFQNAMMGRFGYHSTLRSVFPLPEQEQAIALQSLDRVALLHKALSRVDHLSGGELQRVGIARALAQQPHLILADEPVASLDPSTAQIVMELLHRICKEDGITAVVILHQVELARHYADRIVGLKQGRIVFDDAPAALTPASIAELYEHQTVPAGMPQPRPAPAPFSLPNLATLKD